MSTEEERATKQREAGEREQSRMWRIYRTAKEMVKDRGYEMSEVELKLTFEDFKRQFVLTDGGIDRDRMKFSAVPTEQMYKTHANPPTASNPNPSSPDIGNIWVEFNDDSSVGIKQLRQFAQYLMNSNFRTGILVTREHISPIALKIIPAVAADCKIETFMESDLLVNITQHELVPQHVLLSRAERQALLARYRLKDTQLPRIQLTDPVARYMGLKRGQVVKIIRKSETAGRYASYRLCV